jgi:SAM-dependent methyltransferase
VVDSDIAPDMQDIHRQTLNVYDRHAPGYQEHRGKMLFERAWLDRFLAALPENNRADILDLGCGTGDPIDRYLLSKGCRVTGLDAAEGMLALARDMFPGSQWLHGDMRSFDLGRDFDGVLSWDGFFHLSRGEQLAALPALAAHVRAGGALLLTIGHEDGEVTGTVEGQPVYHASLAIDAYTKLLKELGFSTIDYTLEDPSCDYHSVLLASNKKQQE